MDASSPVKAGQVLAGKYRIERVLGEGGMGVVVEAHDIGLERRVAIKFLLPDFARHAEATQRFMREARAAAKIQSEHVARVIDVSTLENGAPYMVMEFLEGSDLAQVLEAGGPLPLEDVALYVIQACEALAEAHAHGIVHRDLKPANLFLAQQAGGSRKIKVLDFGISKTLSATEPGLVGSLTRTSSMMGSPLYMSPEQMKSARDVDLRTDIWALGVILYEALTASTPFTGNSIPEISAKILLEDPRPLALVRPEIPEALAEVAAKALRKEPSTRFQNVGELALSLLPFAPHRARTNVERIIRVLNAAGISQGAFLASLAHNDQFQLFTDSVEVLHIRDMAPVSATLLGGSGKKRAGTLANFGHTQTERAPTKPSSGARRVLVAAAASVLTIAGGVGFVLRGSVPREGPAAGAAEVVAATAAVPAPSPAAERVTPVSVPPVPPASTEPAAPQPAAAPLAEATEASTGAPLASPSPEAPKPAVSKPVSTSKAKKTTPRVASRKPTSTKPRESSYSGDFKAKFGSRK